MPKTIDYSVAFELGMMQEFSTRFSNTAVSRAAKGGLSALMPKSVPAFAREGAEIHVWRIGLGGDGPADAERMLTLTEIRRADKFAFERDRNRFLHARVALRHILAHYLDTEPRRLPIRLGAYGKPYLAGGSTLGFNLSHSDDLGLLAIGHAANIGIDIEILKPLTNVKRLALSVFSPVEYQAFDLLPDDALLLPFFRCWTRKEAYLKAIGSGLTITPDSITVGIGSEKARINVKGAHGVSFVEVATFVQDDDCIASLAVAGGYSRCRVFGYAP